MIPCRSTDEKREKDGRSGYKDKDQDGCHRTPSMSNSYVPPGQQWNPNQFNFSQLQLEHDLDYSNLSVQGTQRQGRQQQQQLQHQQSQLNYPGLQYSQTQTPSPPHSTSSLHGAFTMPTNQQLPSQGSQYTNGVQHDYASNSYANQRQQQSAAHGPSSNSYIPNTFTFSSSSSPISSAMNLDPALTSNGSSTFLTPQSSAPKQRQSYYLPPSSSKEIIPPAKRARGPTYNDELNPEDADLDSEPSPSDQKDNANRPKL